MMKKKMGAYIWFFGSVLAFSGCNSLPDLPVIGMDSGGNPVQTFVPKKEYENRLRALTETVQNASLGALSKATSEHPWQLRTVVFGIGVNASVGVGPYQVGGFPEMRFVFSNLDTLQVP